MKKKLIISDLDGTLIKHNDGPKALRSVLAKDKECIQELSQKDLFVISTGRNFKSATDLFEREGIDMHSAYFITSNGAQIFDGLGNILYARQLDPAILKKSIELYQGLTHSEHLIFHVFDGKETMEFTKETLATQVEQLLRTALINVCIFSDRDNLEDVKELVQKAGDELSDAAIVQNNWYVDILSKDISKASAITYLIENILKDEELDTTMAIGDSWNDVTMFSVVEESFTFVSSPEDVKKQAKHIVSHFYEAIAYMEEKRS